MLGAIIGDVVGSRYEVFNAKTYDFNLYSKISRFTDDTALTIATIKCLLEENNDFGKYYRIYCLKNPIRGYGRKFLLWSLFNKKTPNNSFGNGSAMRVSPIAYISDNLEEVLKITEKSCVSTHNHLEAIKGSKAIVTCIFLARKNKSKKEIKSFIEKEYGYDLSKTIEEYHNKYKSDATCQNSVPQAIVAFLDSKDFISCLRNAIYIGGDSDTVACMACGIAEAFYNEIPNELVEFTLSKLKKEHITLLIQFYFKYAEDINYLN